MIAYEGQSCLICQQTFSETDDIVVCPDCGTPYHRACFHEQGHCVNEALHASGESWQIAKQAELAEKKRQEKRAEMAEQAAERERNASSIPASRASLYDGVRLDSKDPCIGLDATEQFDGVTMGELSEFVHSNKLYYLPLFRLMKQSGRKMSFNLVSLFFPQLYFANRKMWAMTLVSIALNFLLGVPSWLAYLTEQMGFVIPWIDTGTNLFQNMLRATAFGDLLFSLACCFFANFLYYRFAIRKVNAIKRTAGSEAEFHQNMQVSGGTSTANMVLAVVIQLATSITLFLLLMFIR